MSETAPPIETPPVEPPTFAATKSSRGGCLGCLSGGFVGFLALVGGVILRQGMGLKPPLVGVIVILSVVAVAAVWFPRLERRDPTFAVWALVGLAIMGLVAGFCASL